MRWNAMRRARGRSGSASFATTSRGSPPGVGLAVAHGEEEPDGRRVAVLDRLEERKPPFDPHDVVREFAAIAKFYGCHVVLGDKFAAGWTDAAFRSAGIRYEPLP